MPWRAKGSRGDLWTTIWADDHQLYSVSDDTTGFDNACSSNLAVHSIVRETPPNLRGKTVNPMKQFGAWAEVNPGDGASWKASGLASGNPRDVKCYRLNMIPVELRLDV